jgi:hypothetical protein
MKLTHQLYLQLPNGGRMWVASTTSLKEARECLRSFDLASPGTYSIVDMRSRRSVEAPEAKTVEYRQDSVGLKRWIGFWRSTINALTGS